jgi:hypothetical protein
MPLKDRARAAARRVKRGRNFTKTRQLEQKVADLQDKLAKSRASYQDVEPEILETFQLVKPYTMTGRDKVIALVTAVKHVTRVNLPGDIVECGVWRGGSMHAVARTLAADGVTDRELYLFDTFSGMTEPTEKDVRSDGRPAADMLAESSKTKWVWAVASREDVEEGLKTLPYPYERFHLVEGPVEETIPDQAPETIALLRLDTDWYESTKHELEHLYDRLGPGGILIMDDYGSWQGSKEATDEFLAKLENPPLLHRAGRARIGVKPS